MEYRHLGGSGLKVPVLSFGTATFGGGNDFFRMWGETGLAEANRLIDICLDAGANLFDTADVYSDGLSESILGKAIKKRRDQILISTKGAARTDMGPNDLGSSRHHLIRACEASLRRLNTDYIDIYTIHGFDARTPIEETLKTLDDLVRSGKVRYIGCSNFSGWHLMKSLFTSDKYGWTRYIAHQAYYSLIGRDYEWELMPLALDQNIGTVVWSPLAGGRLTGKMQRNQSPPSGSRIASGVKSPPFEVERLYRVVDALNEISQETGKMLSQIAINWLMQRPTVATVIIGARNEIQLRENLGATEWNLTREQIAKLDAASEMMPIYPYWQQFQFVERNPLPVPRQKT